MFNLVVTNVPGPQFRCICWEADAALLPQVPLAAHQALGIALLSYDGKVGVGCSATQRRPRAPELQRRWTPRWRSCMPLVDRGRHSIPLRIHRRPGEAAVLLIMGLAVFVARLGSAAGAARARLSRAGLRNRGTGRSAGAGSPTAWGIWRTMRRP